MLAEIDDAYRREFLGVLAATGLLTACSTAPPPTPAAATRPFDGAYGRAGLPLAPQRVIAMYATDTDVAAAAFVAEYDTRAAALRERITARWGGSRTRRLGGGARPHPCRRHLVPRHRPHFRCPARHDVARRVV